VTCPVCAVRENMELLRSKQVQFLESRIEFLEQQLVNLADPLALARTRGKQPTDDESRERRVLHSPAAARVMHADIPTEEESARHAAYMKLQSFESAEPEPPVSREVIESAFSAPEA
jgi:hypothetical protein